MNEEFNPSYTFEIKSSRAFFEKLLAEYNDFNKEHLNPRFAINCAINSWHLTDWTYREYFKNDERFKDTIEINLQGNAKMLSGLLKFQKFQIKECPELKTMRDITNGSKHCIINRRIKTETSPGDFAANDFHRNDFDVPRFIIKEKSKIVDFEKQLTKTIEYWDKLISSK